MPRGKEATYHEWDGDFRTYKEIAELTGLSEQSAYRLVGMGVTTTQEAKSIMKPKPRRSRSEILAALPKVESRQAPPAKQADEHTVIIQNPELDKLLSYLAKTTKTSYQDAFNE